MKECPFCKAQIEDHARFCLYCMKPLAEKEIIPPQKKDMRWLFAVIGVALAIAVILLLPEKKRVKPQEPSASATMLTTSTISTVGPDAEDTQPYAEETVSEETAESTFVSSGGNTETPTTEMTVNPTGTQTVRPTQSGGKTVVTTIPATKGNRKPTKTTTEPEIPTTKPVAATKATKNTTTTAATTKPTVAVTTKPTTAPTGKPTTAATTKPTTAPTTKPTTAPTTRPTTAPTTRPTTPPATQPVDVSKLPWYDWTDPETSAYIKYRQAVQADVLGLGYTVTANDIVIVRIEPDDFGYMQIPAYIAGKRVVALASSTFYEGVPTELELPETLLAIHSGVFVDSMPWLFVSGEILAVGDTTETWKKIYTSKTCVNQYGEKFSNYNRWAEWVRV